MKRIILDHFRRWWLVLTAILIAYFVFLAFSIHENSSQTSNDRNVASVQHTINAVHNTFIFQILMFLGLFLIFDLQRGLARVLTSMPVTTKQIGRAWWLASVAFPAMALGVIGLLALLIFSGGTNPLIMLENYLMNWILAVFYLGAIFCALTFMTTMIPDTFTDRIRTFLPNSLFALTLFGLMFVSLETLTTTRTMLIFAAYVILSIVGWFRAETMVLKRAGFRLAPQTSRKPASPSRCSEGRGGLWLLFQTIFFRQIAFGLLMVVAFFLIFGLITSHDAKPSHRSIESFTANTWQFFWIMTFQMIIVSTHIRFLRTLPTQSWKLAAALVSAPLAAMLATVVFANLICSAITGLAPISPVEMIHQGYSVEIAIFTVFIPLVIWRGYNISVATWHAYDVIVFLGLFAAIISYMVFGSSFVKNHFSVTATGMVSLLIVLGSFFITKLILERSSETYRPRTNQFGGWGWGAGR